MCIGKLLIREKPQKCLLGPRAALSFMITSFKRLLAEKYERDKLGRKKSLNNQ